MKKLSNIHPGKVLKEEFLKPMEISAYRLSKDINIPQTRISEIIKGRRRITADTALRLSKYFGNSPKFWLGLQDDFDIEEGQNQIAEELDDIEQITTVWHEDALMGFNFSYGKFFDKTPGAKDTKSKTSYNCGYSPESAIMVENRIFELDEKPLHHSRL